MAHVAQTRALPIRPTKTCDGLLMVLVACQSDAKLVRHMALARSTCLSTDLPSGAADAPFAQRLDTLEVRIAYQDQVIEDLNAVIVAQWTQLDRLLSRIARLEDRIQDNQSNSGADGHDEPPPPHY